VFSAALRRAAREKFLEMRPALAQNTRARNVSTRVVRRVRRKESGGLNFPATFHLQNKLRGKHTE
jgi:hypothetical protein